MSDSPDESSHPRKKVRKLMFEKVFLDQIPTSDLYEFSYMHRDIVTHIGVAKSCEFIISASVDGHVKFWKKMQNNIEFVKHYQVFQYF